jgi:Domain of unknown function (DUF4760)
MANFTPENIVDIFATTFAGISILAVFYQIRETLKWNKKKCAEEALTRFSSGDFFERIENIKKEYHWAILKEDKKYEEAVTGLNDKEIGKLDSILTDIYRNLETICIKIDHDVIDEEVCFDYMFSVLTNFYLKCDAFVKKMSNERNEPHLYEHVEIYGRKWTHRCKSKKYHVHKK